MGPGEHADRLASRSLVELLGKVLVDEALRDKLFTDPVSVARCFNLSSEETEALQKLDRRKLEHAAAVVRWS